MPSTWVNVVGVSGFEQENVQALAEWIERLANCNANALELLSLQDTLALRGAVRDFFTESAAPMVSKPSTDLSEDLSSNSAPRPGPSTI